MPIELPYVGEAVIKELIERYPHAFFETAELSQLVGETVIDVPRGASLAPLEQTAFDGASTIDLVVHTSHRAIPIEVKLGITRLGANRFANDFLRDCERSRHKRPRWNGTIIGFLERRFAGLQSHPPMLEALLNGKRVPLTEHWVLISRRSIAHRLREHRNLLQRAKVVGLEDLIDRIGGREPFNELVGNLFRFDYFERWFEARNPRAEER